MNKDIFVDREFFIDEFNKYLKLYRNTICDSTRENLKYTIKKFKRNFCVFQHPKYAWKIGTTVSCLINKMRSYAGEFKYNSTDYTRNRTDVVGYYKIANMMILTRILIENEWITKDEIPNILYSHVNAFSDTDRYDYIFNKSIFFKRINTENKKSAPISVLPDNSKEEIKKETTSNIIDNVKNVEYTLNDSLNLNFKLIYDDTENKLKNNTSKNNVVPINAAKKEASIDSIIDNRISEYDLNIATYTVNIEKWQKQIEKEKKLLLESQRAKESLLAKKEHINKILKDIKRIKSEIASLQSELRELGISENNIKTCIQDMVA